MVRKAVIATIVFVTLFLQNGLSPRPTMVVTAQKGGYTWNFVTNEVPYGKQYTGIFVELVSEQDRYVRKYQIVAPGDRFRIPDLGKFSFAQRFFWDLLGG